MSTKTVYAYNQEGEYTGETLAYEDPMNKGSYPLPYSTTDKKPPATKTGTVAKWSGDKWEIVPDHRGKTVYEKATTLPVEVDYIGELKDEHTDIKPPKQYVEWKGKWVDRPLTEEEQYRENQNKIMELKRYLAETDYVVIKIAEGEASKDEYAEILDKRAKTREQVRELES